MADNTVSLPAEFLAGGITFRLALTYGMARDLRRHNGVDLINFHNGSAIKLFADDRDKLFETIFKVAEKQAREANLDETKFANLFNDEVFESAFTALEEAIVNFSPPAMKPVILAICQKSKEIQAKQAALAVEKLNSEKANAAINAAVAKVGAEIDSKLEQAAAHTTSGN